MFITPPDVDAKIRVYLRHERILTYRSVGMARCRLPRKKSGFFHSKWSPISLLNYKYHFHIIFFSYIASLCRTFT